MRGIFSEYWAIRGYTNSPLLGAFVNRNIFSDDDTCTLDEHGLLHATVRVSLVSSQVEISPSVTTPRMMIFIGRPFGVLLRGIPFPCCLLPCYLLASYMHIILPLPSLLFPGSFQFSCTWRGNAANSLDPNGSTAEIVGG